MNRSRGNVNRNSRAWAAWRWLALTLCLALLLGGVSALATDEPELTPEQIAAADQAAIDAAAADAAAAEAAAAEAAAAEAAAAEAAAAAAEVVEEPIPEQVVELTAEEPAAEPAAPEPAPEPVVEQPAAEPATAPAADPAAAPAADPTETYTVLWKNEDGSVELERDTDVVENTAPSFDSPDKPTKTDPNYTYAFVGWADHDNAAVSEVINPLPKVNANTTYYAVFSATPNQYTITWKMNNGVSPDVTKQVDYNTVPTYDGETPTKQTANNTTYTFDGWTVEGGTDVITTFPPVTGVAIYVAHYAEAPVTYPVTWKLDNGAADETTNVAYNTKPTHDAPTKAADAQSTYTFAGWYDEADAEKTVKAVEELPAVTAAVTYVASYTATPVPYPVTWKLDPDKAEAVETTNVAYGTKPTHDAPTKDSDGESLFTFAGWYDEVEKDKEDKKIYKPGEELPAVTGAVTYVATYTTESLTIQEGFLWYKLNPEKTEATVTAWTWEMGENNSVVVPETILGGKAKVVAIGDGVFKDHEALASLSIPCGVKRIGANSIVNLPLLATLTLPDSLETLGENALTNLPALTTVMLCCTGNTSLDPATTITHNGETPATLTLPVSVTDIRVTKNNVPENPALLNIGTFWVQPGHAITVEEGATLINNREIVACGGTITCAGTFTNLDGTTYIAPGEHYYVGGICERCQTACTHNYVNGVCTICGVELPKLTFKYKGGKLEKVYDSTTKVKYSQSTGTIEAYDLEAEAQKAGFSIEGLDDAHKDVTIKSIKLGTFKSANVGDYELSVDFTLEGADAEYYQCESAKVPAAITKKTLTITPYPDQKKVYGAKDPSTYTGKVKGLLSADKIDGKLSRDAGENAGKYRITQGDLKVNDNYNIQVMEEYFTIEPKSINSSDVGLVSIGNQLYTGKEVEPEITLRYGSQTLVKGTDFKVEYKDNVQPGTATVTLTGMGNYNGTRQTNFRILNVASNTGGGSSGGGSSGSSSYSYDGFDDGEGDDEDDEDEKDEDVGKLIVKGEDLGTILYTTEGEASPFVIFEEEIEDAVVEDPNAPKPWRLTIIADPKTDEETGETMMLEDGERELYDELHLRLTPTIAETLINRGCTEIVYEVESAEVHIPLTSLVAEIPLNTEEQTEVVSAIMNDEDEDEDEDELSEGPVEELEVELNATSLQVVTYDICVEQIETLELTERETQSLAAYQPLAPAFRVNFRAVVKGENGEIPQPTTTVDADGNEITILPEAVRLPDGIYPEGVTMRVMPTYDLSDSAVADEQDPEKLRVPDATDLFISRVDDPLTDADVVTANPAAFIDEEGMLYAEVPLTADGIYALCAPLDSALVIEPEGDSEDDDVSFDDNAGGGSLTGTSFGMGSSFTVDENGKAVFN